MGYFVGPGFESQAAHYWIKERLLELLFISICYHTATRTGQLRPI